MKRLILALSFWMVVSAVANDFDRDGKPWFQKYFDSGEVHKITGVKRPLFWYMGSKVKILEVVAKADLPGSFDLRHEHPQGALQPIRNQGSCGSCWAFSVIAGVESAHAMVNPGADFLDLSEQELVSSCSGTGGDCGGGYYPALSYIKMPGLPIEEDHPYLAKNSWCRNDVTKTPRILSWKYIGSKKGGIYRGPTIEQLKSAIYYYRQEIPVTVKAFSHSGSGIYTSCYYGGINHMVNLTGWHDFETQEEIDKYKSKGYWIMRNSWGKSFGENGYGKVLYTDRYGRKCNNLGEAGAVVTVEGGPIE